MCDTGDIGSVVDLANLGSPALFVYDKYPGGLGFALRSFERVEELFNAARELIMGCSCENGCPSCVGSPLPPNPQLDPDSTPKGRIPDKEGALVMLHDLLEMEPYLPKIHRIDANPDNQENRVEADFPPVVRLPEKIEEQLRNKIANFGRKNNG
jgi:DEAD/DEAH box helicase domain-containing protein